MGLSRRAYAAHRGVSEKAVRKALAAGRIALDPDGTIDPARADIAWSGNSAPIMGNAPQPAPAKQPFPSAKVGEQKPVSLAAVEIVRKTLLDSGLPAPPEDGVMTFAEARTANEILKAQERQIKLDKLKSVLVDRAKAAEIVFNAARRERDAWTQWPARVAALIAADIGGDPHTVETVLDSYVRKYLDDLAAFAVEFR